MKAPMPICQTCGKPCKRRWCVKGKLRKYCSVPCVPRALRSEAGRKGRQKAIVDSRLSRFREDLKRLQSLGRITGQELVTVFGAIADREWRKGYAACESKWLKRPRRRTSTARKVAA